MSKFYVYILFDLNGVPRYVGKGHGKRWFSHEKSKNKFNRRKREFINSTLAALGEIPKVKIRENIEESEAFDIEVAFIRAIGIYPDGPLVNRTTNRNGPSSTTIKAWHASRTKRQRRATAAKVIRTIRRIYTKEEISNRMRENALNQGSESLSKRMSDWQASRSPKERSHVGRLGGLASQKNVSSSEKQRRSRIMREAYMKNTTPEQRKLNAKKTGLAKSTHEQLSSYGSKGATIANANRTPEERSTLARKAALAGIKKRAALLLSQSSPTSAD